MGYFIGIQASDELEKIVQSLRSAIPGSEQEWLFGMQGQTHITLAHLGKQLPDTSNFEDIGMHTMPFEISVEGVSIFRNQKSTHLVLPIIVGLPEMRLLRTKLRKESRTPDRVFNAHMTVATVVTDKQGESASYRKMLGFRAKFQSQRWGRMVVNSFQLCSSTNGVAKISDRWSLRGHGEVM